MPRQFQFGPSSAELCAFCGKALEQCQCSTVKVSAEDQLEAVERATAAAQAKIQLQAVDGRYRVLEAVGVGGMGTVFRAEHMILGKKVAIKVLRHELLKDRQAMARFEQEARACAALYHPNLVSVFDCGIIGDDNPYLVMEFLKGRNLLEIIEKSGPMPVRQFLDVFIEVCNGLAYAHANGVVHRDLKPSNILLCDDPRGGVIPKIVDFGVAKIEDLGGEFQLLTNTGEVFGSPSYMSPEQCQGNQVDQRSDIYALGCVMYEAISGKRAFKGANIMTVMHSQVEEMPSPPVRPLKGDEIPEPVKDAIMRCLEKEPLRRFQNMDELAFQLIKARDDLLASRVVDIGRFRVRSEIVTGVLVSFAVLTMAALYPVLLPGGSFDDYFGAFKATRSGRSSSLVSTVALAAYADDENFRRMAGQGYYALLEGPEAKNVGIADRAAIAVVMLYGMYKSGEYKEIVRLYGKTLEPILKTLKGATDGDPAAQKVAAVCAPLIYYYVARAELHTELKEDPVRKFTSGIDLAKKLKSPYWVRALLNGGMGQMYRDRQEYKEAMPLLKESFDLWMHEGDYVKEERRGTISDIGCDLADSLEKTGKREEALTVLTSLVDFERTWKKQDPERMSGIAARIIALLARCQRMDEAKRWQNKLAELVNDSVNKTERLQQNSVPYVVLLERAQWLKHEMLPPVDEPFLEALARAREKGASDVEVCAVASSALRTYADIPTMGVQAEQLYFTVLPSLSRIRKSAESTRAGNGQVGYTGSLPMLYYSMALSEYSAWRYDKTRKYISDGKELCQGLTGQDGTWVDARLEQLLGDTCLAERKWAEALIHLKAALKKILLVGGSRHVQAAQVYFSLAKGLDAEGKYDQALENIKTAVDTVRGNPSEEWRANGQYWPFAAEIEKHRKAAGK